MASFGDEPFEIPEILRFLPGLSLLSPPDAYPHRPELIFVFDAGSIDRLGILAGHASRADQLIVVDHHASNTRFGTVNLIDPAAAATAMLVLDLIDAAGVGLTRDIAFGLYAGLVADTGSFKYPATTPAVHQAAARLLGTGIEPGMVARELWDRAPFGYLGLLSAALGRAVLEPDAAAGTAWCGPRSAAPTGPRTACPWMRSSPSSTWCAAPTRRKWPSSSSSPTTGCGRHPPAPRARSTWAAPAPGWAAAGTVMRPASRWPAAPRTPSHGCAGCWRKAARPMARDARGNAPSGLIVVDKPGGMTSHDVVARIRRLAGTRRVGHAGTLTPWRPGCSSSGWRRRPGCWATSP